MVVFDRISALLKELKIPILSRFDVKDAVRTSALSNSWRCVWTFLSELTICSLRDESVETDIDLRRTEHLISSLQGYNVTVEGRVMRQRRLPCCGIGIGWLLFILGFFLAAIPWYVGAIMLCFSRVDYREKPGYIGCTIAAVLATIAIIVGATKGADDW